MQVEVDFFDEFGQDFIFPKWPDGGKGMPPVSKLKANRLIYSHHFLAQAGFSLSMSDKISDVKRILEATTPMLRKDLAISVRIGKMIFNGVPLEDHQALNDYQVRVNTAKAQLMGKTLDQIQVHTYVVMNVRSNKGHMITIPFEKFPRATTTCQDVMEKIQAIEGTPVASQHVIREYPSLRPVKFVPAERVLGFAGKFEKGLWAVPPHNGPVHPATIPTPPDLTLRMTDSTMIDLMNEEEEWWNIFKLQHIWEGEVESYSGWRETITIKLEPPTQAVWKTLRIPGGVESITIHPQITTQVSAHYSATTKRIVAMPDPSPVQGFAILPEGVISQDADRGQWYLPAPEELIFYHKNCTGYELGKSFGIAKITVGSNPPVACTYRLKVGYPTNKIVFAGIVPHQGTGTQTFHVIEGEVAKGISQTYYIRGLLFQQNDIARTPDALRRPFCVFQQTIGGTVPEVVTSPMGIRYAALKSRSYTAFGNNFKLEKVGDHTEWLPIQNFLSLLPSTLTRVVLAQILFETGSTVTLHNVIIYWCFPKGAEEDFCASHSVLKFNIGRKMIRATTAKEAIDQLKEIGTPIGLGCPTDEDVVAKISPQDMERLNVRSALAMSAATLKRVSKGGMERQSSSEAIPPPKSVSRATSLSVTAGHNRSGSGTSLGLPAPSPGTARHSPPGNKRYSNIIGPSQTRFAQPSTIKPVPLDQPAEDEKPKEPEVTFALNVEVFKEVKMQPTTEAIDALSFLDAIYKREEGAEADEGADAARSPASKPAEQKSSLLRKFSFNSGATKSANNSESRLSTVSEKSVSAAPSRPQSMAFKSSVASSDLSPTESRSTAPTSAQAPTTSSGVNVEPPTDEGPSRFSRKKSTKQSTRSRKGGASEDGAKKDGCVIV